MHLTDWLDDLSVRFIVNLPREELESVERICFQVEEAQWFYEDFVRPLDPKLPSLNLRQFSMKIFQHCPLFSSYGADVHSKAFSEFLAYKTRVPVRGAIMLNENMDEVILVKGWKKGANWSFPRGKINKDEKDIDCAVREVYEETGFDIRAAGLVGDEENAKFIEVTMREQHMKLFVFAGIPMETHFEPRTRKEISKIQWYKLSDLPILKKTKQQQQNGGTQDGLSNSNKFYMVAPFLNPLKRIITSLRKEKTGAAPEQHAATLIQQVVTKPQQAQTYLAASDPPVGDMARLMTKLRESKQAHRENNLPEVTNPMEATRTTSIHLESLLGLPTNSEPPLPALQEAATVRELKANAMLSLLRAGNNDSTASSKQSNTLSQTTFEQFLGQVAQTTASPLLNVVQSSWVPDHSPSSTLPYATRTYNSDHFHPGQDKLLSTENMPSNLHPEKQSRNLQPNSVQVRPHAHGPTPAPYQRTGDPQFSQAPQLPGKTGSVIPLASELPPPKLNPHSSILLNLFRSDRTSSSSPSTISNSLLPPNENTRNEKPELAIASLTSPQRPLQLISADPGPPQILSPTTASVAPSIYIHHNENSKRSSQQDALLDLFRLPKPSPSLIPAEDLVELAAQGSPTYSRTPSEILSKLDGQHEPQQIGSQIKADGHSETPAAGMGNPVSATVTGPLNVPQFEKILRRPRESARIYEGNPKRSPIATKEPQIPTAKPQLIKILPRPNTANNAIQNNHSTKSHSPKLSYSPQVYKNAPSNECTTSFQPQILKRPERNTRSPENTSPDNNSSNNEAITRRARNPEGVSKVMLTRKTPILDRRSGQSMEQKATLLNLFSTTSANTTTSSLPIRTGSVVSPLSEKPSVGSGFSSPVSVGKSRLESSSNNGGETSSGNRAIGTKGSVLGMASSSDKKFLLGFLDGVVKEGRM